ncbi:hypothetical protein [Sphingobacterium siyangense]|uniref:hypothetical protein n=1 Tax=Sphingobacterium siyangense TaxID=459529 RepID=UPI003DA67DAD
MVAPDGMCELFLCDKRNLKGPVGQLHGLVEHKGRAGVILLFDQELKAPKEFIDLYILKSMPISGEEGIMKAASRHCLISQTMDPQYSDE